MVYLRRTSQMAVIVKPADAGHPNRPFVPAEHRPERPQRRIVRLGGSLWFGAVLSIGERSPTRLEQASGQKLLLMLAEGVNFVDVAGADILTREIVRPCNQWRKRGSRIRVDYRVGLFSCAAPCPSACTRASTAAKLPCAPLARSAKTYPPRQRSGVSGLCAAAGWRPRPRWLSSRCARDGISGCGRRRGRHPGGAPGGREARTKGLRFLGSMG